MSDPFSNPWKRAVAWVIPILLWGVWLAASLNAASSASDAIGRAEVEIGQDLQACLDFALKDFSIPDPEKQAACRRNYEQAEARLPGEQRERTLKLRLAQASAATAAVMALVYFVRVPRRLKAGVRGFILAVVIAGVLGGVWLLLALSGMPHLG